MDEMIRALIRRRLEDRAGLSSECKVPYSEDLKRTEWSYDFESLMRNRLVMGAMRYGRIGERNKPTYDRPKSIAKRLAAFVKTRNKELLVDIANLCLLEFVEGEGQFEALDSREFHVESYNHHQD